MNETLTDLSPMPFGKYKGKPMQEVPVDYLHWIWNNGIKHQTTNPVHKYIETNLDALKMENEDLIW